MSATSGRTESFAGQPEHRSRPRQSRRHHQHRRRQFRYQRHERRRRSRRFRMAIATFRWWRGCKMDERARLSDIQNLYVYRLAKRQPRFRWCRSPIFRTACRPIASCASITSASMSIYAFPAPGHLASEITNIAVPKLQELQKTMPPGYRITIGGEYDKQQDGFRNLAVVLADFGVRRSIWRCYSSSTTPSSRCWSSPPLLTVLLGAIIRAVGHEHVVRLHGVPRHRQLDRRHRQPRDRAVRLHRGDARQG